MWKKKKKKKETFTTLRANSADRMTIWWQFPYFFPIKQVLTFQQNVICRIFSTEYI